MLENYISKLLSARPLVVGTVCIALCTLVLSGCGGGGGANAACVAALGALGSNACKNGTSNNNTTPSPTTTTVTNKVLGVLENGSQTDQLSMSPVIANSTFELVPGMGPFHGTLVGPNATTGVYTYTPSSNQFKPDYFWFRVRGSSGQIISNEAEVQITVTEIAIPVTAQTVYDGTSTPPDYSKFYTVAPNTTSRGSLDTTNNYNGNLLTFGITGMPAHGQVQVLPDPSGKYANFAYTPVQGYLGTDSFTYSVHDNYTGSDSTAILNLYVASNPNSVSWTSTSNGILGVYNNYTAPTYQNINVGVQATCGAAGTFPNYSKGANWPSAPAAALNLDPVSGAITGALSPTTGSAAVAVAIPVIATCPAYLGYSQSTQSNLFQIYVLPTNVIALTSTATSVGGLITPAGTGVLLGKGPCTQSPLPSSLPVTTTNCTAPVLVTAIAATYAAQTNSNQFGYTVTPPPGVTSISALVLGGGGGGAAGSTSASGAGGGAGGFLLFNNNSIATLGPFTVIVGLGGAGGVVSQTNSLAVQKGSPGYASSIGAYTALGGLGGTGPGGSGGGEQGSNALNSNTTTTTPFAGGTVVVGSTEGGGGGADGVGGLPTGGLGAPSNISGTTTYYGAGGAGGSTTNSCGVAGTNADGNGGTGGLGGIVAPCPGLIGDSGIVIISF